MKIIISGGGTGGHIYPAIAIAQELKKQLPTCEILFVGAEGKMEMEKVPKAGFDIIGLPIRGLQRGLNVKDITENIKFPFRLATSFLKAYKIVKNFQPNVCIGVGGYASGALMQVAALQGIPTLIHEANSYAGLTNKLLSKFVNTVCVSYPNMEKYFPKSKIVFTGMPVRNDLLNLAAIKQQSYDFFKLNSQQKTLLVVGGSLGARSVNNAMIEGIETLLNQNHQVIWQTGSTDFSRIKQVLADKNITNHPNYSKNLLLKDFIYEMQFAYSVADVVISRAGAGAISELALAAKPSILVPLPTAAEDHQTQNAKSLVALEAAILVKDSEVKTHLINKSIEILNDTNLQATLSIQIKTFAKPKATEEIVAEILKIAL